MINRFLDSFTGGAGNFVGRSPDGVGGAYTIDNFFGTGGQSLTSMVVDGSGNLLANTNGSLVSARSLITPITSGHYVVEMKWTKGSVTDSSLRVFLFDSTHQSHYPVHMQINAGGFYNYYLTYEIIDVYGQTMDGGNIDLGTPPSGEITWEWIASPTATVLKQNGSVLFSSVAVSTVSPDAVSLGNDSDPSASPKTILSSVRVYEPSLFWTDFVKSHESL